MSVVSEPPSESPSKSSAEAHPADKEALRTLLAKQLPHVIQGTDFSEIGELYRGKVRDCYKMGQYFILVATDRLSAFDRQVSTVPFKGEVLTRLSCWWFEKLKAVCESHFVAMPHPNVMIVRQCEMLPVEVVVRAYLSGSLWRAYKSGQDPYGLKLPAGLHEYYKFPKPIITPTTKAAVGLHDEPLPASEVVLRGFTDSAGDGREIWDEVCAKSIALFEAGAAVALERGLLLADTKYEFGIVDGRVVVADEIHTLDCTRYWDAASYESRIKAGEPPHMLDKEVVRRWLIERGFSGEGECPAVPDSARIDFGCAYIDAYRKITGEDLAVSNLVLSDGAATPINMLHSGSISHDETTRVDDMPLVVGPQLKDIKGAIVRWLGL